ncbi:MAG: dihydrofolate reductase [Desulfuromonadales bacterium]|nr:dihydrofolate reductase [Desulfuromonadales bacterium]
MPAKQRPPLPLAILVAMTTDRVIGVDGRLPWHLPEDLALFRRLTLGNSVLMGRRTFDAIGHPLAQRHNIVLSRTGTAIAGVTVCTGILEGLACAWRLGRPLFIIGGEELYRRALPIVDELHISWVRGEFRGDRHFPAFDLADWGLCEERELQGFRYCRYRRAA